MRNILVRIASRIRYSPIFDEERFNAAAEQFGDALTRALQRVFVILIGCAFLAGTWWLMPNLTQALETPLAQLTLISLLLASAPLILAYLGMKIIVAAFSIDIR